MLFAAGDIAFRISHSGIQADLLLRLGRTGGWSPFTGPGCPLGPRLSAAFSGLGARCNGGIAFDPACPFDAFIVRIAAIPSFEDSVRD